MKQIFKTQQGIKVVDVPVPEIEDNEILVKTARSMISTGTETASMKREAKTTFKGKINKQRQDLDKLKNLVLKRGFSQSYKLVRAKLNPQATDLTLSATGYSVSGRVVAIGKNILNFNIGDRVACAGSGIAAHAEYVAIPRNLAVPIPENVSYEEGAFTTIGSIALHGLRRSNITFGDTIVITGLGLLGLLGVQIAKAWGLNVIALDIDAGRLALATKLGADYVFNADDSGVETFVCNLTNGFGADAVVIYASTKSDKPVNQAMKLCRRKGTVTIVGNVGMNIERDEMYLKEINVVMSTSYGPGRYDELYEKKGIDYPIGYVKWTENRNMMEFVRLLALGKVNVSPLISKVFTIDEAPLAFTYLQNREERPIGAMIKYNEDWTVHEADHTITIKQYNEIKSDIIKVGLIGTGGFIQGNHLPNLKELKELFSIYAICDKNHVTAANLAKKYEAKYATTDYHKILEDKEIDLVIIGTRHNLHAKLAMESLQADKHVLVEKPMAMNLAELDALDAVVRQSNYHITAGYNRRYSPFADKIQEVFQDRISALIATYRINAGSYPLSNWIHDPIEGGGRIIGEACHFIDFLCFIIGKPIKEYSFYHLPVDGKFIQAHDNLSLNLAFSDGSIGSLIYTSIGNRLLDKEKVEIFGDGKSVILDNFISLQCYGAKDKNLHLKSQDKGFKQELREFAQVIKGQKAECLSWDSIYSTTKLTIDIMNDILSPKK